MERYISQGSTREAKAIGHMEEEMCCEELTCTTPNWLDKCKLCRKSESTEPSHRLQLMLTGRISFQASLSPAQKAFQFIESNPPV
jgi:hypothetical protein